jgi:cyclopropane fatty-acyl-phospholipid synthase-like methyltransferase
VNGKCQIEGQKMTDYREYISADYYQKLHDENAAFMANNWLVDELENIRTLALDAKSVLELGCGNGRFLELAAAIWPEVTGIDWAKSKHIDAVVTKHSNISFIQADVTKIDIHKPYDLVVSADFLEHLPSENLDSVIAWMLQAGKANFHKIACYDDGHSHLSILPPEEWLKLFHAHPNGKNIRIKSTQLRKGNPKNIVITLSDLSKDD